MSDPLLSFRINLVSLRASKGPLFPKPVSWLGLFLVFLTANRLQALQDLIYCQSLYQSLETLDYTHTYIYKWLPAVESNMSERLACVLPIQPTGHMFGFMLTTYFYSQLSVLERSVYLNSAAIWTSIYIAFNFCTVENIYFQSFRYGIELPIDLGTLNLSTWASNTSPWLQMNDYVTKIWAHMSQYLNKNLNIKGRKRSWGPFRIYQLISKANSPNI